MSIKVKLKIFEGPLDLLLFLIKKEKIDIYDIPITTITEQYLEYLELMKMLDLEIAGEFLVVAATLIHIKSKMLLPPEENEEEEEDQEDPRDELVKRLLEYKKFKEAADHLKLMHDRSKNVYFRRGDSQEQKIVSVDGQEFFEASLFDLITAFRKVLVTVPRETFHKVVRNKYSVSDKIHHIYHVLSDCSRVLFGSLFSGLKEKDEVIVTFLAVLELMKMREILAVQKDTFSDIEILRNPELVRKAGDPGVAEKEEDEVEQG